jgi:AcrR family transcriptional regulator
MPRLWSATVASHRAAVRDAILDAAASVVGERGLRSLTMAAVAERAGIGRATLYKYFPDADALLRAWHGRQVAGHLADLEAIRDRPGEPGARLQAVLERFADAARAGRGSHDAELTSFLHGDERVIAARHQLHRLLAALIEEAAGAGSVRADVPPDELAAYCLSAVSAADGMSSAAARRRLVLVTLAGLRP